MLDSEGVKKYWEDQTLKGDNPCHYHNKWQDKYAFEMRMSALNSINLSGVEEIVDVGCGIGEYTTTIAQRTGAHIHGFDFPFNIEIARRRFGHVSNITFHEGSVPDEKISQKIKEADLVLTTTVFVHFSNEARDAFFSYIQSMPSNARVILLEYMPDSIPDFQKKLSYKRVMSAEEIKILFQSSGFVCEKVYHVNFIDSFLFHHFGPSFIVYFVTKWADTFLRYCGYTKSKYKMLTFKKYK